MDLRSRPLISGICPERRKAFSYYRSMSADVRRLLSAGGFPDGSMLPKVETCAGYAESTDNPALIIDVDHLKEALEGRDGTRITG